jgi:hypothetical protein
MKSQSVGTCISIRSLTVLRALRTFEARAGHAILQSNSRYKLWADGKEQHIQQEWQCIVVGLQEILEVVQGKAMAALTDSVITDSAVTDSAVTGCAVTDNAVTESAVTDSAVTGCTVPDSAVTDSAAG